MRFRLIPLALAAALLASCASKNGSTPSPNSTPKLFGFVIGESKRAKSGEPEIPPSVQPANGLTQDEAVQTALWNNAAFGEALADVGVAKAEVVGANELPNPSFSMLFPLGEKQMEFVAKYPSEALWLRPRRVKVATRNADSASQQLLVHGLDLIRDVRLAHTELDLATESVSLVNEDLKLAREISKVAQAKFDAGDASEIEVVTVRSQQLRAEDNLIKGETNVKIARERLRMLLGLGMAPTALEIESSNGLPSVPSSAESIIKDALAARPDVRAAELAIEAAAEQLGLAEKEIYTLIVMLDANGDASAFEAGPGIDVQLPILNQNQSGKARARAKLEKAERHYLAISDQIILEVRESHTRAVQARRRVATWRDEIIPPLENAVAQIDQAYRNGDATFLQVLETTRQLTDARVSLFEARGELRRAAIELERSAGRRLAKS